MYAICNKDAATTNETVKDFTHPAMVDRNITSRLVWKKKKAITETAIHPTIPLISAGFFQTTSIHIITAIGVNVNKSELIDITIGTSLKVNPIVKICDTNL